MSFETEPATKCRFCGAPLPPERVLAGKDYCRRSHKKAWSNYNGRISMGQMSRMSQDIEARFAWRQPDEGTPVEDAISLLHERFEQFAGSLCGLLGSVAPVDREQALALTKLEESMFWAEQHIIRHG